MRAGRYLLRTLRGRLLLALLGITVLGLFAMGATSLALLERSLVARLDERLVDMSKPLVEGPQLAPLPPPRPVGGRRLPTDFRLLFFHPDGSPAGMIGPSENDPTYPLVSRGDLSRPRVTVPGSDGGADWRVRVVTDRRGEVVAVALPMDDVDATVGQLFVIELVVGAAVLIALATVGAVTVRVGLRPLTRIEHTANAIAGGELDRRVADQDPHTETGRLGGALNTMLGRLIAALQQREQSEHRLRRFVADASHELRTPLTSIRGFAELYRRSDAPPEAEVRSMMARIESEAVRMSSLVEDLLMLARLDRERTVELSDLDLAAVVDEVAHDGRVRDPEREITVRREGAVHVLGDRGRLRQVLDNLVTNALVHTPPGTPVDLWVGWARTSADALASAGVEAAGSVMGVVEVADQGPGIPAEHASRVFDRFYRVADGRQRPDGGSGLGLAITTALAEAHNGRVELHANPRGGSRFRLLLPLT